MLVTEGHAIGAHGCRAAFAHDETQLLWHQPFPGVQEEVAQRG